MDAQQEHMATSPIDNTQILQSNQSEISPSLLLTVPLSSSNAPLQNLPSAVMQEPPSMIFPNKTARAGGMSLPVHVSMPTHSQPVYMPPMDPVEPPPLTAQPPNFIPDFPRGCDSFPSPPQIENSMTIHTPSSTHSSSASPPQSQIPSPGIHNITAFAVSGGVSSLASALDPAVASLAEHNHLSAASVAAANAFSPDITMNQPLATVPVEAESPPNVKQEDRTSPPLTILETVLDNIVAAASTTKLACQNNQVMQASNGVSRLQSDISVVTQLMSEVVSHLRMMNLNDNIFTPPNHPVVPGLMLHPNNSNEILTPSQEQIAAFPAPADNVHLRILDSSRKRCASAVDEERTIKSLKREPQEHPLLNPSPTPQKPSEASSVFPLTTLPSDDIVPSPPVLSTVAPTSAPPTPPPIPFPSPFNAGPSTPGQVGFPFNIPPTTPPPVDYSSAPPTSVAVAVGPPLTSPAFPSTGRAPWSETITLPRHRHSLSAGSLASNGGEPILATSHPTEPAPFPTMAQPQSVAVAGSIVGAPVGRMSRSGSISGTYTSPFGFSYVERPEPTNTLWPEIARGAGPTSAPTPLSSWYSKETTETPASTSSNTSARGSPSDDDDDEDDLEHEEGSPGRRNHHLSLDRPQNVGSDIPQEYRIEVDRIFFEYLNKICSNLDATDSKGEPIHQTLMAKKMQRLDESPDFRPFKFRIQAFTHGFLEELSRQGYPEEKIPMKKVRNYLWKQQYILRFNEDGKKAKSKGNHIWNIEAKKAGDGKWEFRPFYRKLAGNPPGVAYCGLKWSWTPRIWDPQASFANVSVQYSSPSLPPWLSWKDDVLSGVPPTDAQSCEITVIAKYVLDGQEGQLSSKLSLNIAPVSTIETSFSQSRRSSIGIETPATRRSTSDSVLPPATQRGPRSSLPGQGAEASSQGAQVIRVLTTAAQRVAHERQSHLVSAVHTEDNEIQDLVKQQHVLTRTASACDKEISGQVPPLHDDTRALAVAAQSLVMTAAETVLADRTYVSGAPIAVEKNNITVNEVSAKTQDAVAQAVKLHGTQSTEVDIMMTATSILKEARAPVSNSGMLSVFMNQTAPMAGPLSSRSYHSLEASEVAAQTDFQRLV
ncbi:hypothetical protein BDN71DRAFT_1132559 [Pleurotus eryngii]|uniref:Uncharacterized protein n=1 Tax=Pleurotus eryngii TaxID=5323 RepID=A0A9P6A5I0_PLEER|nr:hypothetical protein BDN71DRAFT_1132559 [Pleurotus eryngii]